MVRSRSSSEATAEEWRLQDGVCHACSSKLARPCNLASSQYLTPAVAHAAYGPWDLVRSRPSFDATSEEWRLGQSMKCVQLKGITALQSHSIAKSYPKSFTLPRSRAFATMCLASRTTEIMPSSDETAGVWRFENEAHLAYRCVRLGGDTAAVARLCPLRVRWSPGFLGIFTHLIESRDSVLTSQESPVVSKSPE